jgi:hypothetical protein
MVEGWGGKVVALVGKGPDTTEQEQTAGERSRDVVQACWCCRSELRPAMDSALWVLGTSRRGTTTGILPG